MQLFLRVICVVCLLFSWRVQAEESAPQASEQVNAWGTDSQHIAPAEVAVEKSEGFDIFEYVVKGNSVLTVSQVEKEDYPYMFENL